MFAFPPPCAPQPLSITLKGITNDGVDPGIDTFRTVTLPLVQRLAGLEAGLELKVGGREGGWSSR
jgi:RNA 3'-terminal phosphate cyclase-like protein